MFETALKARIPIIGVQTDDLPNAVACLQLIAQSKVMPWPTVKSAQNNLGPYLFWTDSLEPVSVDNYKKLAESDHQLVVLNPDKQSSLVFDAGVLPTPPALIQEYLKAFGLDTPPILAVLKGLSLKLASEVVQLTMARTGGLVLSELRRTRTMLGGAVQGLYPLDTDVDFYVRPAKLDEWLETNTPYFLNPKTPLKLMPRGLMLSGVPGTGKTMAAREVAKHFKVPLFRLDIATSLNKYIGESEGRIARALSMVEKEAPCVLLIDEVEKIFGGDDSNGVTTRILSQLLWWLSDHKSKVLTLMTTNNLKGIPPELYRPGRLDMVLEIPRLNLNDAKQFAVQVFQSVLGTAPTMKQQHRLRETLEETAQVAFAHSEVADLVYGQIKARNWLPADVLTEIENNS